VIAWSHRASWPVAGPVRSVGPGCLSCRRCLPLSPAPKRLKLLEASGGGGGGGARLHARRTGCQFGPALYTMHACLTRTNTSPRGLHDPVSRVFSCQMAQSSQWHFSAPRSCLSRTGGAQARRRLHQPNRLWVGRLVKRLPGANNLQLFVYQTCFAAVL
jgi:hypothetical protein